MCSPSPTRRTSSSTPATSRIFPSGSLTTPSPLSSPILLTFLLLRLLFRHQLSQPIASSVPQTQLTPAGRITALGLLLSATALVFSSAFGLDLGLPTCLAAIATLALVTLKDRRSLIATLRHVSWGVLPLVAGLFVIVEALNTAGALQLSARFLRFCAALHAPLGKLTAALGVALLSNAMNNLPVGLASASALQLGAFSRPLHEAVVVGVDLGPNLSVTGSLATILWLIALRRDGLTISPWHFLKLGAVVMLPTLLASVLALL